MEKKLFVLIFLFLKATLGFSCLNTYQFKIFPIGLSNDKIVTIDFQIKRGHQSPIDFENERFTLYSFLSTYNGNQKLASSIALDTTIYNGSKYENALRKAYKAGFLKAQSAFPAMEYFTPSYISFCDFQKNCEVVKVKSDKIKGKDFLTYDGKVYPISLMQDTAYYGFGEKSSRPKDLSELYISSVRIFKTDTRTLVISHFCTGHEMSKGWITSDPKKAKSSNGKTRLSKEYKANFDFKEIRKSIYIEPLMHHGYGFDVFILK